MGMRNERGEMRELLKEIRKAPPLSEEKVLELLIRARAGERAAIDELALQNQGLVVSVAMKIFEKYQVSSRIGLASLISVGNEGLLKAFHSFEPAQGKHFSTFAYPCVQNAILDFLKTESRQKNQFISAMESADLLLLKRAVNAETPQDQISKHELSKVIIPQLLGCLPPKNLYVMKMKFGFWDKRRNGSSIQRIARLMTVSVSEVEELLAESLHIMRSIYFHYLDTGGSIVEKESNQEVCGDADLSVQEVAKKRLEVIRPYLEGKKKLLEIQKESEFSRQSLCRWVAAYKKHGLAGLVPKMRRPNMCIGGAALVFTH